MLPELRVSIDTLEPVIELQVEVGPSGEVKTGWELFDENLQGESLQLEVQTAADGPWQPIAIDRSRLSNQLARLTGDVSWWPKDAGPEISIRAEVKDASGNVAVVNRRLALPSAKPSAPLAAKRLEERPPPISAAPPASDRLPPTGGRPATPVSGPTGLADAAPPDPFTQRRREPLSVPSPRSTPWPIDAGNIGVRKPNSNDLATGLAPRDEASRRVDDFSAPARQSPLPSDFPSTGDAPSEPDSPEIGGSLPAGERPQMTTSRRFRLDYDVEAVGPSGLGKVELWYTRDRGRSWHSKGYDADKASPFEVEVDSEGLFGFRILIENGDGLASRMPQAGDTADLWVTVDWSAPVARLTSAIYGVGAKAGHLEIGWRVEDANLTDRPIALSFSEQATGPWSTIAAGLDNTGSYSWKVDPRTPERIFLRLEVRDEAGNAQVDQLREPISIEGLSPKGRIRGFKLQEDAGKEASRDARRR
jgi:hypothetical protein